MKHLYALILMLTSITYYSQYCPALPVDQILPCGVGSTTLTADLSQCGVGTNPKQTTTYQVASIPYAAQTNTGTQLFMGDDTQQGPFNIGFNFCFFGQTYTQFWVGSNGWIAFSGGQPTTFTTQTIPTGNFLVPKNCIMGPWQDWHPGIGGQAFLPEVLPQIREARDVIVLQNYNVDITVDGGVSDATAASCSAAGANIMVAGSHLFSQSDLTQAVANLRAAAGSANVSG